jgi:hypothetical protein
VVGNLVSDRHEDGEDGHSLMLVNSDSYVFEARNGIGLLPGLYGKVP